jgi:hypothetical protein
MNRQIKAIFLVIMIGIALMIASCGPQSPAMDEAAFLAAVDTAVAATDSAQAAESQLTQDAMIVFTHTPTNEPPATNTAIPDSPTPQPIFTETPTTQEAPALDDAAATPKFTLRGPAVQVSVDTNCRSGPGKSYAYMGALVVGDEASIYGLDPSGSWYYINNPDKEDEFCWIWGYYAQTSGNTAPLPVYTPGPTPLADPNFSVGFREVESCGGAWQVEFEIVNIGGVALESVSTFVQDTVTDAKTGNSFKNAFERKTGCTFDKQQDSRGPGETGFTVSLDLANNPTGHLTYASVKVCTLDNVVGACRTREFYFTP